MIQALSLRAVRHDIAHPAPIERISFNRRDVVGLAGLLLSAGILLTVLCQAGHAATTESIRTPWPLLPHTTLFLIAASWALVLIGVWIPSRRILTALQSACALFATTAIAPLVYRLGFGFDGFLHLASEKILLTTGALTPKPFYYIGQYVFTTWLARISDISLASIDRWLVPTAVAILLPTALLLARRNTNRDTSFLILALLPLAPFVATTPQSFAYILGLVAFFLLPGVLNGNVRTPAPAILLAWAIAVHPLAGIPMALIALAVVTTSRTSSALRSVLSSVFIILAGASVPLLFLLISSHSTTEIHWNLKTLAHVSTWIPLLKLFSPFVPNAFVLWPMWASVSQQSLPLFFLTLGLLGWTGTSDRERSAQSVWIGAALCLWIASLILKQTGDFAFLVDYERGNYADRLSLIALLSLLPALIPGIERLTRNPKLLPRGTSLSIAGFFVACAAATAYTSLPRHDALVTGRGWSTGALDIEAVKLIDRDANGIDYTVLANQSVSAAAVATLGFKRYADDVFFYPIPTGGRLYETFLRMTYQEPSRETAQDAGRFGKSTRVYVVLNSYWWRADALAEDLKHIANHTWSLGDGRVMVYRFDLASTTSTPAATSAPVHP